MRLSCKIRLPACIIKRAKDVLRRLDECESAATLEEAEFVFRALHGLYQTALSEGNPAAARKTRKGAKR